jgi:hypothetical protein
MALTLIRWLAAVVVSCALVAVGILHGPVERRRAPLIPLTPGRAFELAQRDLARTNDHLRALEIRDSLIASAAGTQAREAGFSMSIDPALDDSTRHLVETAIQNQLVGDGARPRVPVIVAVVLDTARTVHGLPRRAPDGLLPIETFLPTPNQRECVVLGRMTVAARAASRYWRRLLQQAARAGEVGGALVGPCAFYAAFGLPGPAIARWLGDAGWRLARFADWRRPPAPWADPFGAQHATGLARFLDMEQLRMRGVLAPEGLACGAGRAPECGRALATKPVSADDTTWQRHVVTTRILPWWTARRDEPLGPSEGWLLSDMAHSLGRDRFARFWQSGLEPDTAFRAAAGHEMAQWVGEWVHIVYGRVTVGPAAPAHAAVNAFLLIAMACGVAVTLATRRRVG